MLIEDCFRPFYSENVVYLPGSYQVNDGSRTIGWDTPTRAQSGLPEKSFVFCCLNNSFKFTPDVFSVWMKLLKRVDDSVLWLLESNDVTSKNLRNEAESRGVAGDRIIFAPRVSLAEHLARYRLADLFVDTWYCNAHTTASDALWAGLPLITRYGSSFAGRVASSLLGALGLTELITHSSSEYEALALRLAQDAGLLNEMRERLAKNCMTHPLFKTERFAGYIEAAYVRMYEIYHSGGAPESFAVAASA